MRQFSLSVIIVDRPILEGREEIMFSILLLFFKNRGGEGAWRELSRSRPTFQSLG